MKLLLFILGITSNPGYKYVDYCEKDLTNLSLNAKIEMTIGCSEVQGEKVYSDDKLRGIYERRKD